MMNIIKGGVCSAKGFTANGVHCGIRKNRDKKDLALIYSAVPAKAAAVYTTNLVKGAPLAVTKAHIADGIAQAVICNSGNANTCNANGIEIAEQMSDLTASALGISASDIVVASTGVIGEPLEIEPIAAGIPELVRGLSRDGGVDAAEAIMTTDTISKEVAVEFEIGGKICTLGGIAKGSGMIHPNMATMLVFLTSDVAISSEMLQKALSTDITNTFNMLSIDGDTSTNDTVVLLANGLAENPVIEYGTEDYKVFAEALHVINEYLAKKIAGDGEGCTALFEVQAVGCESVAQAKTLAKSIVCSNLTKTAIAGHDANWGRILCAMGYSGAQFDPEKVDLFFESAAGKIQIIENGTAVDYSEEEATKILSEKEVKAIADVKMGEFEATAWGCDLTHGYIEINADYRS